MLYAYYNQGLIMKIKFEWEIIHEKRGGGVSDVTLRAKVIGGWLIKSVYCEDDCCSKGIREHAIQFIPDLDHKWEI